MTIIKDFLYLICVQKIDNAREYVLTKIKLIYTSIKNCENPTGYQTKQKL